jgi:hypothetical protein
MIVSYFLFYSVWVLGGVIGNLHLLSPSILTGRRMLNIATPVENQLHRVCLTRFPFRVLWLAEAIMKLSTTVSVASTARFGSHTLSDVHLLVVASEQTHELRLVLYASATFGSINKR